MLRSGTSGSITPLSAPSPSDSRNNSDGGSPTADSSSAVSPTATTPGSSDEAKVDGDPTTSALASSSLPREARPKLSTQRTNSNHCRHNDFATAIARPDGLLSAASPATTDDMFRTPSQISVASDADGYFTARPGSPVDPPDLLSLSMLRTHSAKARNGLRRDRVSWSGRSYATCASDVIEADLAAATSASLSIDDEACFVDGRELSMHRTKGKAIDRQDGARRIDFLSLLPPELSLCIVFELSDHKDLLCASLVSKRWRALALDATVWRHLFFSQSGWAIREDAPLVVQHQAELQRMEAKAKRTAAKQEAERLRRLQEQRKSASTSSPYLDRLAALKSWRETLHIPSFPHLAGLSLTHSTEREVDVDTGRPVAAMSPLRSPTAATGRFGLFLSPVRAGGGAPSTPAGARRAQEAAASSYFGGPYDSNAPLSRQGSVGSLSVSSMSRRPSADSLHAEVVEAEEFFAASLDWVRLYRDRYVLEQRWMRGHLPRKSDGNVGNGGEMSRTAPASSTSSETAPATPGGSSVVRSRREKKWFEPTKRFLRGHQDSVYCIRQDDGIGTGTAGKLVSGSRDRTIRVWDVETGACKHILKGHTASVLSLQYDEEMLVSVSSDGQVFVWDFASILATQPPTTPTTETPPPSSSNEAGAEVDPESGALVHDKSARVHCILRDHTSAVLDIVFDANWIVTGSKDATVRVWRRSDLPPPYPSSTATTPPVAWRKFTHTGPVNAVDLQANQVVSASGEGSMFLWDLNTGEKLHTFAGHTKGLACIVFKGTTLVSGSNDQTIRVWDTRSGNCTHVLGEHHMLVRTVAYDAVRKMVVSGGYDRMIKLWLLDSSAQSCPSDRQQQQHQQQPAESPLSEAEAPAQTSETAQQQQQQQDEQERAEAKPAIGKCLRDIRCHRARIFDVDFTTTRIVSASEDHLICITNFGGQGLDTSLFA